MHRSIRNFNIAPRKRPGHLNFWRYGVFPFPIQWLFKLRGQQLFCDWQNQPLWYFKLGTFGSNSPPYPGKGKNPPTGKAFRVKFPAPRALEIVKCPGYARGDVEVPNWSAYYVFENPYHILVHVSQASKVKFNVIRLTWPLTIIKGICKLSRIIFVFTFDPRQR